MKGKICPVAVPVIVLVFLFGLYSYGLASVEQSERLFPRSPSTADHKKFKELDRNFSKAPDVTAQACLKCHNLAGNQLEGSLHWTWRYQAEGGRVLGKANVLNNF
jgi:hypothetical protein